MTWQNSPVAVAARRRVLVRTITGIAVLLAVLVVAAVLWPRPQPGGLSVPTSSSSVEPSGVLQGSLDASRSGDRVCYSITTRGATALLRFVPGWTADDRLGLRDPAGLVVAQPGDEVVLLGAPGRTGAVAGCPEQGRVWTITSLRLAQAR